MYYKQDYKRNDEQSSQHWGMQFCQLRDRCLLIPEVKELSSIFRLQGKKPTQYFFYYVIAQSYCDLLISLSRMFSECNWIVLVVWLNSQEVQKLLGVAVSTSGLSLDSSLKDLSCIIIQNSFQSGWPEFAAVAPKAHNQRALEQASSAKSE